MTPAPTATTPAAATGTRPRTGRAPAHALAGTAAVMLALGGGKWGAYLGLPPLFPLDLLLAVAAGHALTGRLLRGASEPAAERSWPGPALAVFLAVPVARFLVGDDHSLTAVRDLMPYGYAWVAFLAAAATVRGTQADRDRTVRLLDAALLFHLAWVLVVLALPMLPDRLPMIVADQELHLFSIRLASDGTVVGVTAALYLVRLLRDGGRWNAVVVALSLAAVASMAARAALVATAVAVLVAVLLCFAVPPAPGAEVAVRRRRMLLIGLAPLLGIAVAAVLPLTTAGSKLLSSIGITEVRTADDVTGLGTKAGRSLAWRDVLDYVAQNDEQLVGVGFGPDYLYESGARVPLGNDESLRLPHSFVIGTYARLGLLGLMLLAVLVVAVTREVIRQRHRVATCDLRALSVLVPAAFLASGALGVQIESPFGAVPFYWCLGVLLCRPKRGEP